MDRYYIDILIKFYSVCSNSRVCLVNLIYFFLCRVSSFLGEYMRTWWLERAFFSCRRYIIAEWEEVKLSGIGSRHHNSHSCPAFPRYPRKRLEIYVVWDFFTWSKLSPSIFRDWWRLTAESCLTSLTRLISGCCVTMWIIGPGCFLPDTQIYRLDVGRRITSI